MERKNSFLSQLDLDFWIHNLPYVSLNFVTFYDKIKSRIQLLEAVEVKVERKNSFLSQLKLDFWIYNLPYVSPLNFVTFMTSKKSHIQLLELQMWQKKQNIWTRPLEPVISSLLWWIFLLVPDWRRPFMMGEIQRKRSAKLTTGQNTEEKKSWNSPFGTEATNPSLLTDILLPESCQMVFH